MKIATIIGARPQFIKASMVSKEISKQNNIKEILIIKLRIDIIVALNSAGQLR